METIVPGSDRVVLADWLRSTFAHVERVLKLASARQLWLHRGVFGGLGSQLRSLMGAIGELVRRAGTPVGEQGGAIGGLVLDLTRSRKELLAENAFLRHQLLVAVRKANRPKLRTTERLVLVSLAALFARWRDALVLVQPETLLRWHRGLFRWFWARRSQPSPPKPRLAAKVIGLIKRMAIDNRTWGAKRIRGE